MKKTTELIKYETMVSTTKTKEIPVWISDDGLKFRSEIACELYEKQKIDIELGQKHFKEFYLSYEQMNSIINLITTPYKPSNAVGVIWAAKHDDKEFLESVNYLKAKGHYIDSYKLKELTEEGEVYCCFSWDEDEGSDYPSTNSHVILLSKLKQKIQDLQSKF